MTQLCAAGSMTPRALYELDCFESAAPLGVLLRAMGAAG